MEKVKTKELIQEFFKLEKEYWKLSKKVDDALGEINEQQLLIEMEIKHRKDLTQTQKAKFKKHGIELWKD